MYMTILLQFKIFDEVIFQNPKKKTKNGSVNYVDFIYISI